MLISLPGQGEKSIGIVRHSFPEEVEFGMGHEEETDLLQRGNRRSFQAWRDSVSQDLGAEVALAHMRAVTWSLRLEMNLRWGSAVGGQ